MERKVKLNFKVIDISGILQLNIFASTQKYAL